MRYVLTLLTLSLSVLAGDREVVDDLVERLKSKDTDEVLKALTEAGSVYDKRLMPPLTKLLKDKMAVVRERTIEVLALRSAPASRKKAASALAARLKPLGAKEETRDELLKVIQALHDLAQPHTMKALLDGTNQAMDRAELQARLLAVGNVPTKDAVDRLIQFGSSGRRRGNNRGANALQAVRYATQMDVPRGDIDVVRKWWSENRKDFDPIVAADKRVKSRAEQEEKAAKRKDRKNRRKKKDGDT